MEKINHLGLDRSHTLIMKGLEDSAADSLKELTHHVVPQVCCDVQFSHMHTVTEKEVQICHMLRHQMLVSRSTPHCHIAEASPY